MTQIHPTITITRDQDPEATARILASLPSWFGIPEANAHYEQAAAEKASYLAVRDGQTIGVALVDRHFPETAEIHLIAVHAEQRGSGAGAALIAALEADARADGARLLEVKTTGASFDDPGYAETRAFYAAQGFLRLEEFQQLDWDGPTVILVKPL